ncbi:hypothetical protein J6590_097552, partial [Homalodisca vitripennis]
TPHQIAHAPTTYHEGTPTIASSTTRQFTTPPEFFRILFPQHTFLLKRCKERNGVVFPEDRMFDKWSSTVGAHKLQWITGIRGTYLQPMFA